MSKIYGWSTNQIKLNRAIALSVTKEEEDVKRLYVSFGGLVKPGYVASQGDLEANITKATPKEVSPETPTEPKEFTPEVVEETIVVEKKKPGRPAKNAK